MINNDQCSHGVASARSWQGSGPAFITFLAQSGPRSSAKKWPVTVPTDRSSSWPKSSHPMSGLDKPWETHLGAENMRRRNLFMFMINLWYFAICFLGVLLSLSLWQREHAEWAGDIVQSLAWGIMHAIWASQTHHLLIICLHSCFNCICLTKW